MTRTIPALALVALIVGCSSEPEPASQPSVETTQVTPSPTATRPASAPEPTDPAPANGRISRYTTLSDCKVVATSADEGPFTESECQGLGGYRLRVLDADGRETVSVIGSSGGRGESLALSEGTGGGFSRMGDTVEWRGPADGSFMPDALILRHYVTEDPDQPERETAYLVTVMLAPVPCKVARTPPGPEQNVDARAIADDEMRCIG